MREAVRRRIVLGEGQLPVVGDQRGAARIALRGEPQDVTQAHGRFRFLLLTGQQ